MGQRRPSRSGGDDPIASIRSSWLERRQHTTNGTTNDSGHDGDGDDDAHFWRCWRRQDCKTCLGVPACSWCPFSATCVPNDHHIPALAPAFDGDLVCPYWAERWELRTRPLGCQVSTITSLTALVAGSGTLLVAALLWLLVWGAKKLRKRWRQRRQQQRQEGQQEQSDEEAGGPTTRRRWPSVADRFWRRVEPREPQPTPDATPSSDERTPLLAT